MALFSWLQSGGGFVNCNAGATVFFGHSEQTARTTEADAKMRVQATFTVKNFHIYIGSNTLDVTATIISRKNGSNGNISVSIGSTLTGHFTDITHSDSVVATNDYNFQASAPAGSGQLQIRSNGAIWEDTVGNAPMSAGANTGISTNGPNYFPLAGKTSGSTTTEANREFTFRFATVLSKLSVYLQSNTSTSQTVRLRKNGANGNQVISIGVNATGYFEDASNTDSMAAGDRGCISVTGVATGAVSPIRFGLLSTGVYQSTLGSPDAAFAAGTTYLDISGNNDFSISEEWMKAQTYVAGVAQSLQIKVSVNSAGSATTFVLRQNAADTALTISIGAAATGLFEDTTHAVALVANDYINTKLVVPSGSVTVNVVGLTLTSVQTYVNTPSGGMTLGGSGLLATVHVYATSGGITLAGSGPVSETYVNLPTGGMSLGGTALLATTHAYTGSGGLALAGSAGLAVSKTYDTSGGMTLGGTAPLATTTVVQPSGGMTLGGSAPFVKVSVYGTSGGITLAGTAPFDFTAGSEFFAPAMVIRDTQPPPAPKILRVFE